ncbi:hypothetical protein [Marinitoga aeolica]|uniref:Big-1 domain-containing protein n=1 Tax=Marinitoga aeolica TaxID=2809031 RepID=A0ABY8PT10_9BACT|nr:hypothetical protein [Marinitoga aeolica]WGS65767.1 hypothetical protein JRV97_04230 [Marinitoga aeolica]
MKIGKSLYLFIFSLVLLLALTSCITRQPVPLTVTITKAVTGINGVVPVKTSVDIQWAVGGVDSFNSKIVVKKDGTTVFEKSGANLTSVTIPEDKFTQLGEYSYFVEVKSGEQIAKTNNLTFNVVPSIKEIKLLSENNTSIMTGTSKIINWEVFSYVDDRNYEYKIMLKKPNESDFTLAGTTTNKVFELDNLNDVGNYSVKVIAVELGNIEIESPVIVFQVANETYEGENHFPEIWNPLPENGKNNVSWDFSSFNYGAIVTLSWSATDVDNDYLTFDVYVDNTMTATTDKMKLSLSGFSPEETHSWYVVAKDDKGFETKSDTWSFTLKSNTDPIFETPIASEVVKDSVVRFTWTASDIDNDELLYDIYSGTQEASTLLEKDRVGNFFNTENKNGDYIVVVKDPFGGTAEKEFSYTPTTESLTGNATVVVYVTDAKSGPIVPEANITINNSTALTDDTGMATFTFNISEDSTLLTIEATKTNHALTKVDGLMLKAGETKKVYLTLRKAELNPDPDTQELPEVEFHVYDYSKYISGELDEISLDSSIVSGPIVVTIAAKPKSNDHINIIYASLGKTPGSSFMTGDRGYTSGASEVAFAFNTFDYNGLTDLHITVYDYNDNQIELVKYLNILNNNDVKSHKFIPQDWASYGIGTNLDAYTRRMEIGFYSQKNNIEKSNIKLNTLIKNNVDKKIKAFENKFGKSLNYTIESAPNNTNLWVEVWWIPADVFDPDQEYYQWPNGYNIYRSFDGSNWEKIGYVSQYAKTNKVFRDYSPELEPGKEVHYAVSSVYDDGETEMHYLGSVTPLGMFDVQLTSPSMLATNVARAPIFEITPITNDHSLDNATFEYALWIYDLVQSDQHLLPGYIGEDGKVYQQMYDVVGPYPVNINYLDQQWFLLNANGLFMYNDYLQPNKTYSWAVDLAYAMTYDGISSAISVSIDQGYGVDPFGGVDADAFNTFTTGSN